MLFYFLQTNKLNWALKTVFYRSRNKCSTSLRISEAILSLKQRIDLKSFDLLYSILKNDKSVFQNHLKLPTMSFRINERNKKLYWKSLVLVSSFMGPSFIPVWEVGIPYPLNWEQSNTREKNGRNLSTNTCYNFTKIVQLFIRTIFGMASNFSNSSNVLLYFNFILITTPTVPNKLFFLNGTVIKRLPLSLYFRWENYLIYFKRF